MKLRRKQMKNPNKPATGFDPCSDYIGLSKREYIATAALQAYLTGNARLNVRPDEAAKIAIEFADELLKKLEER